MGYANIPFAIGWTSADYLGGLAYDKLADKANLAIDYMRGHGMVGPDEAIDRTKAVSRLMENTHLDAQKATELLWTTYHPYTVWYPFVGVGIVTAFAMIGYARVARTWTRENA